jgi:hypothetical protein
MCGKQRFETDPSGIREAGKIGLCIHSSRLSHLVPPLLSSVPKRSLSRYYAAEPTQRGVVLGYGGLERQEIEWIGKQIVAQVIAHSQVE